MTATMERPGTEAGNRDGFGRLVHAEWTKFRTVRGWVIAMVIAAALTAAVGLWAASGPQTGCQPAGPDGPTGPPVSCTPTNPVGPLLLARTHAGEVTNGPACTVAGRPARLTVPTWVQCAPSAESYPVSVSPDRTSRSQRGEAAETAPGRPGVSPV